MSKLILSLIILMTFSGATYAQQKVLTATVTEKPGDNKLVRNSAVIKFSETISSSREYYRVIGKAKSEMKGNSSLINELYYEPGLLAMAVYISDDSVELVFMGRFPSKEQLSNIYNRVIKIVQQDKFPNTRLEINNYDPLLGATVPKLANYKVPPPIKVR